jgi:hypothetical protein
MPFGTESCETSEGPTHHGQSPVKAEFGRTRHRTEHPEGRAPGTGNIGGLAPTEQVFWGRTSGVKPQGLNKKSRLGLGVGVIT